MPVIVVEEALYAIVAEAAPSLLFEAGVDAAITAASYAVVIGSFYAYGSYQERVARGEAIAAYNQSLLDRLVMTTLTNKPRSRVYGRVRNVDGVLYKGTHGSLKQFYTFVVAVAGHEIDGFEQPWFADQPVTLDVNGYVQTEPFMQFTTVSDFLDVTPSSTSGSAVLAHSPVAGTVSVFYPPADVDDVPHPVSFSVSGSTVLYTGVLPSVPIRISYQWNQGKSYARVRTYTGAASQDLSGDLLALGVPDVDANFKFHGMACMLVTLEFNTDVYSRGVPSFTSVIRGAKCFDPRSGLTVWTENSSIIARDWATYKYGGNAQSNEIVDSTFITAANACDVPVVAFHLGDGTPVTKPTYRCGIVCPGKADPTPSLNEMVTSMAGKFAWVGGQLRVKAGAYTAPATDIDETWLSGLGTIDIVSGLPRGDLINIYVPTIANSTNGYVPAPIVEVRDDPSITSDGEELSRDVTYNGITEEYQAHHVATVMLRDARQALTVRLPCNMKAYPVDVFDTVTLTLAQWGWSAKEFEVLVWEFSETGGVVLTMKETAAAIFDSSDTFPTSDVAPNTGLPLPWLVPKVTGLAVTSGTIVLSDGSLVTQTLVTWDPISAESVRQSGTIEVQCASVFDGVWRSFYAEGSAVSLVIPSLYGNTPYIFKARAISSPPLNVKSDWCNQVVQVVARPANDISDWTDVPGRPRIYRAISKGFDDLKSPLAAGLYDENGALLSSAARSYVVDVFDRSTDLPISHSLFDVHASVANATAMANLLHTLTSNNIVLVRTFDEPAVNRLSGGLLDEMYNCGASPAIFGKSTFDVRSAYMLVGIPGCGPGNGYEAYADYSVPTRTFCDVSLMLKGGAYIVTGSNATPGALSDYGYTGTLDATTDLSLVARGNCVVAGNFLSKLGGTLGWNSDVYSRDSAFGACFASAVVAQLGVDLMFGLNSDPTTDQNYTGLDYAFYQDSLNHLYSYESGSGTLLGTVGLNDTLLILYDGSHVRWMQNNLLLRTVAVSAALVLFFDSSFYTPNCSIKGVRFGALSANDWSSIGGVNVTTSQVAANAITVTSIDPGGTYTVNIPAGSGGDVTQTKGTRSYTNDTGGSVPVELVFACASFQASWNNPAPTVGTLSVQYTTTSGGTVTRQLFEISSQTWVPVSPFLGSYGPFNYSTVVTLPPGETVTWEAVMHFVKGGPGLGNLNALASAMYIVAMKR